MMVIDHTIQPRRRPIHCRSSCTLERPRQRQREKEGDTSCSVPCSSDIIIRKVHSLSRWDRRKEWWMAGCRILILRLSDRPQDEEKNSRIANTNRDRCRVCSIPPSLCPPWKIIRRSPPNSTSLIIYHHNMLAEQPTKRWMAWGEENHGRRRWRWWSNRQSSPVPSPWTNKWRH